MSLEDGLDLNEWTDRNGGTGLYDRNNPDSVSLLFRMMFLDDACANEGIYFHTNEAGRPRGVEVPDFAAGHIPPDGDSSQTASGRSTMWFQFGRDDADFTPTAVDPRTGTSPHTLGIAADIDSNNYARLYQLADAAGMEPTILPSEKWHLAITKNPAGWINFDKYSDAVRAVFGGGPKPPAKLSTAVVTRRRR